MFAQVPDPISGGAGWVGAGLLGAVLCWLLLKHLPDKDRQIKELLTTKDAQIAEILAKRDAYTTDMAQRYGEAVKSVVEQCRQEAEKQREAAERYYKEQVSWLSRIFESSREAVHAARNLQNSLQLRTRLAEAIQSAEVPIWLKALDGTLLSWNAACEGVLGWSQGEVVGRSVYDRIIPPERRQEEQDILRRIGAGESVPEYETERMAKDGRRVKVLATTSPVRDQTGRVIGASTIAREA